MKYRIGIDVGGTFTDFLLTTVERGGFAPKIFKVLSTPKDPSQALIGGLNEMATSLSLSLREFAASVETIVHGTTVTTNAVLTHRGAKTALLTTRGVRDALEMRRGIREEQYNNRYQNVEPLVPRHLRIPISGRMNYRGDVIEELSESDVQEAVTLLKRERVEAVAICFMNSFANPSHEKRASEIVMEHLPEVYLSPSYELIPSIRFYDRLSSTVLNGYVGPKLNSYLTQLERSLKEIGFCGVLRIMQSNGGVMSIETARQKPALTLLSGPAAGPGAGLRYVQVHGKESCMTVDMGGTSFDAALIQEGVPAVVTDGEINRHRIALPMLDIVTIGAGGGSIGWLDEGGLLQMGPQSAGADPGPVCYGKGGVEPTCTDANLVLGYLSAEYFAGGQMRLDYEAAHRAIEERVAKPLKLSVEEAAFGMYQVVSYNMAQGVREVSIKRGIDPREFPMVVAGGAGPLHACQICQELEIPTFVVPRESSIFCAAGMLMSDLHHDFVSSFVSRLDQMNWKELSATIKQLIRRGDQLLDEDGIDSSERSYSVKFDCRYVKQFHEVSFEVDPKWIEQSHIQAVASLFHWEHEKLYGYRLADDAPIELINIRCRSLGRTKKPHFVEEERSSDHFSSILKGERLAYLPEERRMRYISLFDGDRARHGFSFEGPALIEQKNTTLFLSSNFSATCDRYGSFVVYRKGSDKNLNLDFKERWL